MLTTNHSVALKIAYGKKNCVGSVDNKVLNVKKMVAFDFLINQKNI